MYNVRVHKCIVALAKFIEICNDFKPECIFGSNDETIEQPKDYDVYEALFHKRKLSYILAMELVWG